MSGLKVPDDRGGPPENFAAALPARAAARTAPTLFKPALSMIESSKPALRYQSRFQSSGRAYKSDFRLRDRGAEFPSPRQCPDKYGRRFPPAAINARIAFIPKRDEASRLPARPAIVSVLDRVLARPSVISAAPDPSEPDACCEMFSRIPTAASVGTSDDPPYEINGKRNSFGRHQRQHHADIEKRLRHNSPYQTQTPTASRIDQAPAAPCAIPRQRKTANTAITASAPTSPNSSPITAKMKSE